MSETTIEVQPRESLGKNANRRLRAGGQVPAVVYGSGKDTVAIQLSRRLLADLLKTGGSENKVLLLKLGDTGKSRHVMIRDLQVDPVSHEILHVDFQRIEMTKKVHVEVPVELVGTAVGVKTEGGMLDFVTRELEVECLPGDIPDRITVDVSELHLGEHLEARQLDLGQKVTLLEEPERVIVSIAAPRTAEAEAEEAAAEELLEAEPVEPELIRRGKVDEEETEAEEG